MLTTIRLVLVTLIVLLCWLLIRRLIPPEHNQPATLPTIEQVQALASLVTTRVEVADIQETEIRGYTGGIKGVLLIRGDFLLTVDLTKATFEQLDQNARTVTLRLPEPEATNPRLDHQRTKLFALRDEGLWVIVPGNVAETELVNRAYAMAQQALLGVGQRDEMVGQSKQRAEKVIGGFFDAIGWRIKILWADR